MSRAAARKHLALDAMGVVFAEARLGNLLKPFCSLHGGIDDAKQIRQLYLQASEGRIDSRQLWKALKVDPGLEPAYLSLYRFNSGFEAFINNLPDHVDGCWYLSNDVADWARSIRVMFHLDRWFDGFVVSGETGIRKPDPRIYRLLLQRSGFNAEDCVFVDDKPANVDAAIKLGFQAILFDTSGKHKDYNGTRVRSFDELHALLVTTASSANTAIE